MEVIGYQQIKSLLHGESNIQRVSNAKIRSDVGYEVQSYLELAKKVAELQFGNPDYVLLFRGQRNDHKNKQKQTSLRPSIFRDGVESRSSNELRYRFHQLQAAERLLLERYKDVHPDTRRVARYRIIRWSILQHYEVCPTPLLDVSHSLRITASFASMNAHDEAFLFVLGVPNISGAITASAEAGLETIRLSSVCPPEALRPHIQEAYLLSEYPEFFDLEQMDYYEHSEIDFGQRLIAKFRFDPRKFWRNSYFPRVEPEALYPSSTDDPLLRIAQSIKYDLPSLVR